MDVLALVVCDLFVVFFSSSHLANIFERFSSVLH